MRKKDSGVLILDEWFEALQSLNLKQYKQMVNAIYLVQRKGAEVPQFQGKADLLAKVIFPHVCRRVKSPKEEKNVLESVYGLDPESAKVQDALLRKTKEIKENR